MKINARRIVSLVAALALLLTCAISGLVLPAAAEAASFKLVDETLYIGAADTGGYVTYFKTNALTLDGAPYTEALTWSSSDANIAVWDSTYKCFKTKKGYSGTTTITATNAAGESHSCEVTVAFDGERISDGGFETGARGKRWNGIIKSGYGEVIVDPDDANNHVLSLVPNSGGKLDALYYNGVSANLKTKYLLSFDAKGFDGATNLFFVVKKYASILSGNMLTTDDNGNATQVWQNIKLSENEWTHVEYVVEFTDLSNRNYAFGWDNATADQPVYIDNVSMMELGTAEAIELSETEAELNVGEELDLTVMALPAGATFNRVQWLTSNSSVATVENGKVKAVGEGSAVITAISGSLVATCSVKVAVPPPAFLLKDQELYIGAADTGGYVTYFTSQPITLEGNPYTEPVTWTTSDANIAVIHDAAKGIFKTKKGYSGKATITATNAKGESASCEVTVAFDGERISDGGFETGARGSRWNGIIKSGYGEVIADPDDANNHVLSLVPNSGGKLDALYYNGVSANLNTKYILSFDAKGFDGSTNLFFVVKKYASILSGNMLTTDDNGDATQVWQNIKLSKNEWTHVEYVVQFNDLSNRNYAFGWDNATADQPVYIDNVSMTALGTATAIELSETEVELDPAETLDLTVSALPADATFNRVQWLTSDKNVAIVENGKVTAVGGGTATITAVSGTLTATCKVTVTGASILPPDENASGFTAKVDFDHAPVGFQTLKNEQYILEGVGVNGTKGFMVSGTTGDYVDIAADANIVMLPGEVYIVRFKTKGGAMRLEFGPQGTYAQIPLTETYGNPSEYAPSNADWTTYQRVIAATTSTRMYSWIRVKFNADNTPVYIDDIEIFKISDLMGEMGSFDFEEGRYGLTALEDIAAAGTIVTDPTNAADATDRVLSFPKAEGNVYATSENKVAYLDLATSRRQVGYFEAGRPYTLSMDVYGAAMGVNFSSALNVSVIENNAEKGADGWFQVGGDATKDGWKTYTFTFYTSTDTKVFDKLFAFAKDAAAAAEYSDTTAPTYLDNISVTPKDVVPDKLVLDQAQLLMGLDNTAKLNVAPEPSYATVGKTTWTSSNEAVVTVKNGTVTAVGVGTATITVTMGEISATCGVTVVDEAVSFVLKSDKIHLAPGASKTPTLVTVPAHTKPGAINWTSANTAVATVDAATGKITAVANGTAVITGKKGDVTVTCTVTVDEYGERISGGDFEMKDWNNATFTTNLIKDGVGTVIDEDGNMVLQLPGTASTAMYLNGLLLEDGRDYRLTFKAKGTKVLTTINADSVVNGAGETTTTLSANSWTTVSIPFTYKAGGDKNAVIALTNNGGSGKTLTIDDISLIQLPKATGIAIIPGTVELLPGSSNPLKWGAVPSDAYISGEGIRWSSSDPSIVLVDEASGQITALGKDGQTADVTVTNGTFSKTVTVKITDYANILWNGDFEQGASVNWGNNSKIKPGIGKDGSYGIAITATGDNYFKGDIPAKPGTKYLLTWDYLPVAGSKFKVWSNKLGIGNNAGSASGEGWKTKSTVFTTPASMDLSNKGWIIAIVGETVSPNGPVIVDNLSIRLYSSGVEAQKIALNKSSMTLMPGRTGNLTIQATPSDGDVNRVTWTSSNENVATVEYGVVTGVGKGTATITATLKNGLKATCSVRVSGSPALITNGTFTSKTDKSWTFSENGAEILPEVGVLDSNAASLTKDGSIKQTVTGLKPETKYQIFVRFRSNASGKLVVDFSKEGTQLYNKVVSSVAGWTNGIYEFTTDATVTEADVFTLTIAPDAGQNGPIYVDNVLIAEQAMMIDFVVENIFWLNADDPMAKVDQVKPGAKLDFYVLIKNQGTDAVKAGDSIVIDICTEGKTVLEIPYTFAAGLPAGEMDTIAATEAWAAVEGDHVISARVNSTLSILEVDDTNNNTQQKDLRVNDVILEVPETAVLAGFEELIFSDDFNTTDTFDTLATGGDGYKWYVKRPWSSKDEVQYVGEDYSIKDGILTVHSTIPTYNYTLGTMDIDTGLGFSWQYGYLETRFRIPRPRENEGDEDGVPAIWSLPPSKLLAKSDANLNWVEMDWMEYWGINGLDSNRPGGFYTISIHDTYHENGKTIGQYKNSGFSKSGLGDGEWHEMSWLWQQDLVIGYLDGVEVMRQTFGGDEMPSPMPTLVANTNGTFNGPGAFEHLNKETLALFLGGSSVNVLEMDYVRIWSGTGSGITPPEKDEEDEEEGGGDVLIDMAAEDFINNYCLDDYLEPIMPDTIDEYSYVYVLMGVEIWEQLSTERQAEINAIMAENGQPTYPELVEAAEAYLNKNPEVLADYFVNTFFVDESGMLVTEVTQENYLMVLASVKAFAELDEDAQLAILAAMEAYGLPSYEEMLAAALEFAEADGLTDLDIPELVIPETGETATVWPFIAVSLLFACAVVLWTTRKRKQTRA